MTLKIQLAKEVPLDKIKWPKLAQLKYDGVRLICIVAPQGVLIKSRNDKTINLPLLSGQLGRLAPGVYDGELIYSTGAQDTRTKVSGMVNSAMHGGKIDETKLLFMVFDYLSLEDYYKESCGLSYDTRHFQLRDLLAVAVLPNVKLADRFIVDTLADAMLVYNDFIKQGYEGLILKDAKSQYQFKRSAEWIKLKETKTADLTCIAVTDGEGKNTGGIGALVCEGEVEDKQVVVNVAGLTNELIFSNPIRFIGKTIEVKYNAIIQDSVTKEYSLFLPRFSCERFDK